MKRLEKFSVLMTFAAFNLCGPSAWARDEIVAVAEPDGLKVVPPVLTPKTDAALTLRLALDSQTPPTARAAGEALAQTTPNFRTKVKEPKNQTDRTRNIRLYLGQPFANGQPIATLCDNDITGRECVDGTGMPPSDDEPTYQGPLELSDFLFQGQQTRLETVSATVTIAGVNLNINSESADIFSLPDDKTFQLQNTKGALELIRTLIDRRLIYVVINSNFDACVDNACVDKSGAIIGYLPPKPGTIGDGELRGTLHLQKK